MIDRVAFTIFGKDIYWYGVLITLGLIAGILVVLAFPALFVCLLFLGGLAMLLPLVVLGLALGVLTACI